MYLDENKKIKITLDTNEMIERCLNCEKEKCDNCVSLMPHRRKTGTKRPVDQIEKDGTVIKTFNSINEAALAVGADAKAISDCCKGKQKTAKKYVWRYANAH